MEDPQKVKAVLKQLNKGLRDPVWEEYNGFHTYISIAVEPNGSQRVDTGRGITVKVFLNKKTGETKAYTAEAFLKD